MPAEDDTTADVAREDERTGTAIPDRPRPPGLPRCKACPSRIRRRDGSIIHADDCPLDAPVYLALRDAFTSLNRLETEVARAKKYAAEALIAYREMAQENVSTGGDR